MDEATFAEVVRAHRGDWDGDDADVVREFVESIGRDRSRLMAALRAQEPAYELVPDTIATTPPFDGGFAMRPNALVIHRVIPACSQVPIGHIRQIPGGRWLPYRADAVLSGEWAHQSGAVLTVFARHFEELAAVRR